MAEAVAVGGLLVAGLSLIVGYLDRRYTRSEALRTAIYTRQLMAIDQIADVAGRLERAMNRLVRSEDVGVRDDPSIDALSEVMDELRVTLGRNRAALPKRTLAAADHLWEQTSHVAIIHPAIVPDDDSRDQAINAWAKAWGHVYEEVRRDLGVDRLGDRIRELTGVTKDDQIDRMVREMLTRPKP